jgi:hypothetical protein
MPKFALRLGTVKSAAGLRAGRGDEMRNGPATIECNHETKVVDEKWSDKSGATLDQGKAIA